MNYKHLYHAGNFADVFKHLTLIFCLEKLREKDSSFFAIDTHSGAAKYDLRSEQAEKTGEHSFGIQKFLQEQNLQNPLIKNYLNIIQKINNKDSENNFYPLKIYPGSPYIIDFFLRKQDRAIFCEIKHEEFLILKQSLFSKNNIEFTKDNGFNLTKSKLPPLEKRGLILIDPAFEKNSNLVSEDYEKIIRSLKDGLKRFAHGIYLVWYPIINKKIEQENLQNFYQNIFDLKIKKLSRFIYSESTNDQEEKMNSCGIIAVNAPWDLEEKLISVFKEKISVENF